MFDLTILPCFSCEILPPSGIKPDNHKAFLALFSVFLNKEMRQCFFLGSTSDSFAANELSLFLLLKCPTCIMIFCTRKKRFLTWALYYFYYPVALPVTHSRVCFKRTVKSAATILVLSQDVCSVMHVSGHWISLRRVLSCSLLHTPVVTEVPLTHMIAQILCIR